MRRILVLAAALVLGSALLPVSEAKAVTPYACFYENANFTGHSMCVNVTGGRFLNFRDYAFLGWNPDNKVSAVCAWNGKGLLASGLNGNNYELLGRFSFGCWSYVGSTWNDKASSFYVGYL